MHDLCRTHVWYIKIYKTNSVGSCLFFGSGRLMTWGDGNPATDWAMAAERAGRACWGRVGSTSKPDGHGSKPRLAPIPIQPLKYRKPKMGGEFTNTNQNGIPLVLTHSQINTFDGLKGESTTSSMQPAMGSQLWGRVFQPSTI